MIETGGTAGCQILFTADGGISWTVQYSNPPHYFTDIAALSMTNIWAVGNVILHSTNGGEDWSEVDVGNPGICYNLVCPDDQVRWIYSEGQGGYLGDARSSAYLEVQRDGGRRRRQRMGRELGGSAR